MHIEYFVDQLSPISRLNKFSNVMRSVLYFRIDQKYYLEYHPWKEFGDLSINEMMDRIKRSQKLPPFLEFLLKLEKNKKSISHLKFLNHLLIKPEDEIDLRTCVKLKVLSPLSLMNSKLAKLSKLRIDFNNYEDIDELLLWLKTMPPKLKEKIDFLEDPTDINEINIEIKELGFKLAADRNIFNTDIYDFDIYKPNIDGEKFRQSSIFSSYMGGDLGRYHAYLALMEYGDLNLYHGISTPGIYNDQLDLFVSDGFYLSIDMSQVNMMYDRLRNKSWQKI